MPNLTRFPPVESATGGLKLYGRKGYKSRVFCCQCGERIVRTVNALDKKLKNEDIVEQRKYFVQKHVTFLMYDAERLGSPCTRESDGVESRLLTDRIPLSAIGLSE